VTALRTLAWTVAGAGALAAIAVREHLEARRKHRF
jgi:hypothetical protein